MTLVQIEALALIAGMLVLFMSDRLRYDLVGAITLSAAALLGVVPATKVFSGFSSSVVIIIASALVISRAVAVSGVVDEWMRWTMHRVRSTSLQVGLLTAAVTFLSAFIKNVGVLGIFLPVAIQTARARNRPVSRYLMPLAFGSLIGGTMTQIGTSPNVLISEVRRSVTGEPYHLFDYTSVGLPLSIVAILFLSIGWRLLPANRRAQPAADRRFTIEDYTVEAALPASSNLVGKTVADLEAASQGEVTVAAIIREHGHRYVPQPHWGLFADDILVLRADPTALPRVIQGAGLRLVGAKEHAALKARDKDDDVEAAEVIVGPESILVGQTASTLRLRETHEVNVLAIRRTDHRNTERLQDHVFQGGDIIVMQGMTSHLTDALRQLDCLPLAGRNLAIGRPRTGYLPLGILLVALVAISVGLVRVEIGFFVAATATLLLRLIPVREAYEAIDWPVIVMLGCLIPVGEALKDTGTTELMAHGLGVVGAQLSGTMAVGMMMVVTMLVTPFLHHAAAVLVMGPVAATVAATLGFNPDAFLMAVAFGAACDFLTPIGHQNSTLVMRPAGYLFSDYWKLGLPLTVLVAIVGTWLIVWSWPLG